MLTSVSFAQSNLKEILKNFNKPAKENVMVVSHRGDWRNAPENSIQAFQNCIDMGVDMVELDLKKTKDGVLVLMHDKKIDRTMNGKGFPENYTLDSLKSLRLKNGVGCKTRHQIPTFREVMELCKGKIMVNVDKGYDYFDDAMKVLKETGTVDQCIIKAELPYEVVKAEHGDVLDKMIFMPVVNLGKPGAEEVIDGYIKNMKPKAYELVFKTDDANTRRLIKKVRDRVGGLDADGAYHHAAFIDAHNLGRRDAYVDSYNNLFHSFIYIIMCIFSEDAPLEHAHFAEGDEHGVAH